MIWVIGLLWIYRPGRVDCGHLSFLIEPVDTIAIRHRPLLLDCLAKGDPPINITWYKDGAPLHMSPHTQQLLNGSLWIRSFQKKHQNMSDAGEYSCAAHNLHGRLLSRKAKVQLAFLSHFRVNPQPMSVAEGTVARFQCWTTAVPKADITWERNRTLLLTSDPRFTLLPDGVLQIAGVTQSDVGLYRCLATNPANSRHSEEAALTLTDSTHHQEPVILSGPQNLTLTVHQTAILECIATGNPPPVVSWSRLDGKSIGVDGIQILGSGNLMISNVSVKHSGIYVCAANRPGTRVRRTAQGTLQVQAPPEFVQWPQSVTYVPGDNASFSCVAQGVPPPVLMWLKNGKYLSPGDNGQLSEDNQTLTIVRVTSADEALYQCIAENSAGTNQASARLAVTIPDKPPQPPEGVVALPISTSSIMVTWKVPPPEVTDGIIGYVLHIRKAGDSSTREIQEALSKTTFKYTVNNLEAATEYVVVLRAYSPLGASEDSQSISVATWGSVPRTPDISVTVVNESVVQVEWETSPTAHGYRLEYRKIPSGTFQGTQVLPGGSSSFTYHDLEPSSLYEVKLVAFSASGDGNSTRRFVSLRKDDDTLNDRVAPTCQCEDGDKSVLGIALGIHLGVVCVILGILLLLYRKR
ncbi:immunoglobulin superfamily DCC subclass member 3-like [Leptodactylus fuscus]